MSNVLSMKFEIKGSDLTISLSGRLDTLRAADLEEKLNSLPGKVCNIYFDMDGLEYIASAGLRNLFWAVEYTEEKNGEMKVRNVSPEVREVFAITGFNELIDFE